MMSIRYETYMTIDDANPFGISVSYQYSPCILPALTRERLRD